jgi:hypothetical protein
MSSSLLDPNDILATAIHGHASQAGQAGVRNNRTTIDIEVWEQSNLTLIGFILLWQMLS